MANHQILAEDVRLQLELIQAVLDDVTDAHDAAELAALDHRKVTSAMAGHAGHDRRDALLQPTGDDRGGHQLGDWQGEELCAVLGQASNNVTLRDQPEDHAAIFTHYD